MPFPLGLISVYVFIALGLMFIDGRRDIAVHSAAIYIYTDIPTAQLKPYTHNIALPYLGYSVFQCTHVNSVVCFSSTGDGFMGFLSAVYRHPARKLSESSSGMLVSYLSLSWFPALSSSHLCSAATGITRFSLFTNTGKSFACVSDHTLLCLLIPSDSRKLQHCHC